MNYHLFQKGSQSVFSKIKKKSNQNQNHKIGKECHEHCTIFYNIALLHTKPTFTAFQDEGCIHLHPQKITMFILGNK